MRDAGTRLAHWIVGLSFKEQMIGFKWGGAGYVHTTTIFVVVHFLHRIPIRILREVYHLLHTESLLKISDVNSEQFIQITLSVQDVLPTYVTNTYFCYSDLIV